MNRSRPSCGARPRSSGGARRVPGGGRWRRRRAATRPGADDAYAPDVALVIAAHDEEARDRRAPRERARARLPGPSRSRSLDGSTDGTRRGRAFADRGVRLLELPRAARLPRRTRRSRATSPSRRVLGRELDVGARRAAAARPPPRGSGGGLRLRPPPDRAGKAATTSKGLLALRAVAARQESACGSITGGNGAIYAVRRCAYSSSAPAKPRLGLPFRLRRAGLRSVYEPESGRARALRPPRPRTSGRARCGCSRAPGARS